MRSSRRHSWLAALLILAGAGCTRPRIAPPARIALPTPSPVNAPQVVEAFNAREARIHSLRATFTAEVVRNGEHRSVNGVLVIAKPDRFRFRLMLPFGVTVFDELRIGPDSWVVMPLGASADRFETRMLEQGLLPTPLEADRCQFGPEVSDGMIDAVCGSRRITIRLRHATLAAEWFSEGTSVRYDDERLVDGVALPFRIALTYPGGVSVAVAVDRYEVNPVLGPQLFTPPAGAEHENEEQDHADEAKRRRDQRRENKGNPE